MFLQKSLGGIGYNAASELFAEKKTGTSEFLREAIDFLLDLLDFKFPEEKIMRIRGEKLNTSPAASDRHGPPWRSRAQSSRVQMRVMMHTVMKLLQCTKLHLGRLYICTRTNCWQVVMAHWDAWVLMREVDDDLGEVDDDLGRRRPAHFCLRCKHVLICAK